MKREEMGRHCDLELHEEGGGAGEKSGMKIRNIK